MCGRANAFESQYRENAPRRPYAAPKSNALPCNVRDSLYRKRKNSPVFLVKRFIVILCLYVVIYRYKRYSIECIKWLGIFFNKVGMEHRKSDLDVIMNLRKLS